jgi:hypothetical protein
MLRTLALSWLVALGLLAADPAHAFFLTCADARTFTESAEDADVVTGHSFGVLDMYAGLLCFVGDASCDCLMDVAANRPREFSRLFLQNLESCGDDEATFGVALRTATALCGD